MASLDPQLAAMLNQTVTWYAENAATVGTYGDPTWGAGSSISARVIFKRTIVAGPGGEELMTDVAILTASMIAIKDRVLLPGESVARQAKAVNKATDEDGTLIYCVAYF